MIHGLHAPGMPRPDLGAAAGSKPDVAETPQKPLERFMERVESDEFDGARFQHRLEARFGDAAEGIVGEDGSVDFEQLKVLISGQNGARLQERLIERFGEDAAGIVGEDGTIDREKLAALFEGSQVSQLQRRLESVFGDAAAGIIAADGTIDFEALHALIVEKRGEPPREHDESQRPDHARDEDHRPLVSFRV